MALSFLMLNGIPLPVGVGNASWSFDEIGEAKRAVDGTLSINRRAYKRTLDIESPPQPIADALFLRELLLGINCDTWAFTAHLFSAKGRPVSGSGGMAWQATGGKWGSGSALVAGGPDSISFPITSPFGVTVFAWVSIAGTYALEVASFDPTGTLLLTRRVTPITGFAVSISNPSPNAARWSWSSGPVWTTAAATPATFSDVWTVGRSLAGISSQFDPNWLQGLAVVTNARAPAPAFYLSGDLIDPSVATNAQMLARGKMNTVKVIPLLRNGSFVKTDHTVAAALEEI